MPQHGGSVGELPVLFARRVRREEPSEENSKVRSSKQQQDGADFSLP